MAQRPFGRCNPDVPVDEGYILANVPFPSWAADGTWKTVEATGVVTSEGCACEDYIRAVDAGLGDKAKKISLDVIPIEPVRGDFPEDKLDIIKRGEHLERFFVEGGRSFPDALVKIDQRVSMPAHVLVGLTPVTVLADWQWRRLLIHLTVAQWHEEPGKIFHPDLLKDA